MTATLAPGLAWEADPDADGWADLWDRRDGRNRLVATVHPRARGGWLAVVWGCNGERELTAPAPTAAFARSEALSLARAAGRLP